MSSVGTRRPRTGAGMEDNVRGRLKGLRIIWAALIMGPVMFLVVVLFIGPNQPAQSPDFARTLFYVALVMLAVMIPVGYVVRGAIFRAGRVEGGGVSPGAYANGSIIFYAM